MEVMGDVKKLKCRGRNWKLMLSGALGEIGKKREWVQSKKQSATSQGLFFRDLWCELFLSLSLWYCCSSNSCCRLSGEGANQTSFLLVQHICIVLALKFRRLFPLLIFNSQFFHQQPWKQTAISQNLKPAQKKKKKKSQWCFVQPVAQWVKILMAPSKTSN